MTRPIAPPGPLPWRDGPAPPEPKRPHKPPANAAPEPGGRDFVGVLHRLYAEWLAAGPPWVR